MTTLASPPRRQQLDNSLPAVVFVLIAIAAVFAAVVFLWWQTLPPPPMPVETYVPLPNGASFAYRITNPDGKITYRSRNIYRTTANYLIGKLEVSTFNALMQATNIDLSITSPEDALNLLSGFPAAEYNDVEYDAQGLVLQQTKTYVLIHPDRVEIFGVNTVGIYPPIPVLDLRTGSQTLDGKLNGSIPYSLRVERTPLAEFESGLGTLRDCVVLRQTLEYNNTRTASDTTYCAGAGEVLDETRENGTDGVKKSEILAASAGSFVKGIAPLRVKQDVNARPRNAFENSIGTELRETLNYQEPLNSNGVTTQIVPADGLLLYGTSSGALVALDRASEQEKWRFQTGDAIYSTPIVVDGTIYFGSADKKLYALRVADGTFRWAFSTQDIVSAPPQVGQDVVFVASEDKHLYALDPDTGLRRWTFAASRPLVAQPVVQDNLVFFSTDKGALFALDVATGAERWSFAADKAITARVTVNDGALLVTSYDGTVYALNLADGSVLWQTNLTNEIETPPVVANGRVYVTMPDELIALDAATGAVLWQFRGDRTLVGAPLVMGEQVWQLTLTELIGLSGNSGTAYLRIPTTDSSPAAGLSSDGRELYAGFFDGHVLAFGGTAP